MDLISMIFQTLVIVEVQQAVLVNRTIKIGNKISKKLYHNSGVKFKIQL